MRRDEFTEMRAFLEVARERSFTRAAAKLGVTRSALIRLLTDQNPFVHSLRPMDMMRQGWFSSLRQASQQWATISS